MNSIEALVARTRLVNRVCCRRMCSAIALPPVTMLVLLSTPAPARVVASDLPLVPNYLRHPVLLIHPLGTCNRCIGIRSEPKAGRGRVREP